MKYIVIFLLVPFLAFSQNQKGASPIANSQQPIAPKNTYAVVIGISDYQDPGIPDLKYADRDARAFAHWLRSPEGCNLPDSNIVLLENTTATNSKMIMSLDWLIEASKPGDRAFIYFSGHGDVERVTKFNLGYLLGYDSPPAVYGAGAFSLNYLQAILSTLSENGVQVIVITDACHAGKLAGSSVNGTKVTSMQLSQQFANEIKIMSCQPEEYSLEGEQWGGGRGCFSYHLEDALYGFADSNADATVDLRELRRYLEDHVSAEAAPQSQVPLVNGPIQLRLTSVNNNALAMRKTPRKNSSVPFMNIENKGVESLLLEEADTTVQRLYAQFLVALDSGHLLQPTGQSADDYFRSLLERQEAIALAGTMKRKLAAALIEEGQSIINKVLKTDPDVLDNIWANRVRYDHLPSYFQRATEILGENHYAYRDLKAKEYYFKAMTIRKENYPDSSNAWLTSEKRKWLGKSLEMDSSAAVVFMEMGNTHPLKSKETINYLNKAASLAPQWALVSLYLGLNTSGKEAIYYYKKAIEFDSSFLKPYNWISWKYENIGLPDSARFWRQLYVGKFLSKMEMDSSSIKAYECNDIGNALWGLKEFERAKFYLLKGENLSSGKMFTIYENLTVVYTDLLEFDNAISACEKVLELSTFDWEGTLGNLYFYFKNDTLQAKAAWLRAGDKADSRQIWAWLTMGHPDKAFELSKKNGESFSTGELARLMGILDTAVVYYSRFIENVEVSYVAGSFERHFRNVRVCLSHHWCGQPEKANAILDSASIMFANEPWWSFYHACFYAQTSQPEKALDLLEKSIALGWNQNPLSWIIGTLCDPLLNPIRETEGFKALVREHFLMYYNIATRIPGKG